MDVGSEKMTARDYIKASNEAAIRNADDILKTLIIVNGGGILAVLTFIAAIVKSPVDPALGSITGHIRELTEPVMWFAFGIFAVLVAMCSAYFTNYIYTGASQSREYQDEGRATKLEKWGRAFHILGLASAFLSIGLFVLGVWQIRSAIIAYIP